MIAFVGSVFSPYYAAARRRGPADPEQHVAINVGLYGPRRDLWAMTERRGRDLQRSGDHFRVGPSSLSWSGDELVVELDEITVPVPRRIRGSIRLRPRALTGHMETLDAEGRHQWCPMAPVADIEVAMTEPALNWSGAGYLDSNAGSEPLEAGFRSWNWSRAPLANEGAAILYDVRRRDGSDLDLALRFGADGRVEGFEAPPVRSLPVTRWWRIPRTTRSEAEARVARTLEDTPFYARSKVASRLLGEDVLMVHEALDLDRFASRWVQTLLPFRMPRR